MTCGFRNCQSRACGSTVRADGHELAYCVAHEAIARNLPLLRSAGCCASEGCGRPRGQRSPLCKSCRPRYSAWGLDGHLHAIEAPMPASETSPEVPDAVAPTPPAAPQEAAGVGAPPSGGYLACITPGCGDEDLMDLDQTTGLCGMCTRQKERTTAPPATVEEFLRDLESGDGEPSEGDVADAPLFVGGTDTAPVQPMSPDLDGLAALAARGQQPTAPGPTLAEVQAQLARERERADRAELDAVQERARADEALEELATIAAMLDPEDAPAYDSDDQPIPLPVRVQVALMPDPIGKSELERSITRALDKYDAPKGFGSLGQASPYGRVLLTARENKQLKADKAALQGIIDAAEWIVHHCGSYGATNALADRVLRLLPVERQRAILELQRAEAYIGVTRLQARFLSPPPPGRLEEYAAKVAEIEAKIAALDAGENEA